MSVKNGGKFQIKTGENFEFSPTIRTHFFFHSAINKSTHRVSSSRDCENFLPDIFPVRAFVQITIFTNNGVATVLSDVVVSRTSAKHINLSKIQHFFKFLTQQIPN